VTKPWDIDDAVATAFENAEQGEKYIERLLACCKDASTAIKRQLLLLVLCMAVFELLNRTSVEKIAIAFVELKDQTVVATFLPVVVAYLQYRVVATLLQWRSLERTYAAALTVVEPGVSRNRLGGFVVPGVPLFSTIHPPGALYEMIFSLQQRAEGMFATAASLLLPLFQVYAFVQLHDRADGRIGSAYWAALLMTTVLTSVYLVTIAILFAGIMRWKWQERGRAVEG
jgi:hypothetical protein